MKRPKSSSEDIKLSPESQNLRKFGDEIIRKGLTESNVFGPKLSHEKSVLNDSHITGIVSTHRVQKTAAKEWGFEPGTGSRANSSFDVPCSRPGRPISISMQIAIHFRVTPVTADDIDRGTFASASQHDTYVSRNTAVSKLPVASEISAQDQGRYLERDAAVEFVDGKPAIFSTISDDPQERQEFHALIEKVERARCGKTRSKSLKLNLKADPAFYRTLLGDEELPNKVRVLIENELERLPVGYAALSPAHPEQPADKTTADWLTVDDEEIYNTRRALQRCGRAQTKQWENTACFDQGSSPQIYHRIEGELPASLSVEQRAAALKTLCRQFEVRELPYVAVLHAPDANNDPNNVHFHIIYYARPARRMTSDRETHCRPFSVEAQAKALQGENGNFVKTQQQMKIRREAWPDGTPLPKAFEGKWDFEVEHKYKSGKRSYKTSRPFMRSKVREVTSREWFSQLRKLFAEAVNQELVRAGLPPSFHPGSFEEMGIDKKPEQKMFKGQASREMRGIPTVIGVENELSDWNYRISQLEKTKASNFASVDQEIESLDQQYQRLPGQTAAADDDFVKKMDQYAWMMWSVHQSTYESQLASEQLERLKSRPNMIIKRQTQLAELAKDDLKAFASGPRTKLDGARKRLENSERLIRDAEEHLAKLDRRLGSLARLPSQKALIASDQEEIAGKYRREVLDVLDGKFQSAPVPEVAIATMQPVPETKTNVLPVADPLRRHVLALVKSLLLGVRRLAQRDNGIIVPARVEIDRESELMREPAYLDAQPALQKIKQLQDRAIADVVGYLRAYPSALRLRTSDRSETSIPIKYELQVNQPSYKLTFSRFGDGPEIATAVEQALELEHKKQLAEAHKQEKWLEKRDQARRWLEKGQLHIQREADDSCIIAQTTELSKKEVSNATPNADLQKHFEQNIATTIVPASSDEIQSKTTSQPEGKKSDTPVEITKSGLETGKASINNRSSEKTEKPTRQSIMSALDALDDLMNIPRPSQLGTDTVAKPPIDHTVIGVADQKQVAYDPPADGKGMPVKATKSTEHEDLKPLPGDTQADQVASQENNPVQVQHNNPEPLAQTQESALQKPVPADRNDILGPARRIARDTPTVEQDNVEETIAFIKSAVDRPFTIAEINNGKLELVPLGPETRDGKLNKAVLYSSEMQIILRDTRDVQWAEKKQLSLLLLDHANGHNIGNIEAIIAVLPQEIDRKLFRKWQGTPTLIELQYKLADREERATQAYCSKWLKSKTFDHHNQLKNADLALRQYEKWPAEIPGDEFESMKSDAAKHRVNMFNQVQMARSSFGIA